VLSKTGRFWPEAAPWNHDRYRPNPDMELSRKRPLKSAEADVTSQKQPGCAVWTFCD